MIQIRNNEACSYELFHFIAVHRISFHTQIFHKGRFTTIILSREREKLREREREREREGKGDRERERERERETEREREKGRQRERERRGDREREKKGDRERERERERISRMNIPNCSFQPVCIQGSKKNVYRISNINRQKRGENILNF